MLYSREGRELDTSDRMANRMRASSGRNLQIQWLRDATTARVREYGGSDGKGTEGNSGG